MRSRTIAHPDDITVVLRARCLGLVHGGATGLHAHHAAKLLIGLDSPGTLGFRDGKTQRSHVLYVPSNQEHSVHCEGAGLVVFLEPETHPALVAPSVKVAEALQTLGRRYAQSLDKGDLSVDLSQEIVKLISPREGPPIVRRDPRIEQTLEYLQEQWQRCVPITELAELTKLSTFRLAHLFKETLGTTIRRYGMWQRILVAINAIVEGDPFADAAAAAHFSDHAHLTRSFQKLFGVPPSILPARSKIVQAYRGS